MNLEEMKEIAVKRSEGAWWSEVYPQDNSADVYTSKGVTLSLSLEYYCGGLRPNNAEFIAMAANNWNYLFELAKNCSFALTELKKEQEANKKLLAVVDAAKKVWDVDEFVEDVGSRTDLMLALGDALKALEKE